MNVFVSHAMGVGLAIIVVIALVLSLNSLSKDWSDFLSQYEPKHICTVLQSASESPIKGKIHLSLPDKIAGSDYMIKFNSSTISIVSKSYSYNCTAENSVLQGQSSTKFIYLEFIEPDIVRISDVS